MVQQEWLLKNAPPILALATVAVGAYLPWVRPNPEFEQLPSIGFPRMDAGIEVYSLLLLLGVSLVLMASWYDGDGRLRALAMVLVGAIIIALLLYYVGTNRFVGFDAAFVPANGWYLALIGGVGLLCIGCVNLAYPRLGRT